MEAGLSFTELNRLNFESKISPEPNSGCWLWLGSLNYGGYGRFRVGRKTRIASRVSYEMYIGKLGDNEIVCHRCDNPICVNPSHLFCGSYRDNARDRDAKMRGIYGRKSFTAKLHDHDIPVILAMIRDGTTYAAIARAYGVSAYAIERIGRGRGWLHVVNANQTFTQRGNDATTA